MNDQSLWTWLTKGIAGNVELLEELSKNELQAGPDPLASLEKSAEVLLTVIEREKNKTR